MKTQSFRASITVSLCVTVRVRSFPEIENWSENSEICENEFSENSEFTEKKDFV